MKLLYPLLPILIVAAPVFAQLPAGYYDGADGLNGSALQQALHDIIDDHEQQSYSSLHTHYYSTDRKPDGTVWDMYSDVPGGSPPYTYNFNSGETCGNYSGEGDCYNREHSWPKSWFDSGYPMYTDLFHVVPSDGYVNGQRSNYPYGEVSNPSWTSQNGSKRGPNSYPGYSGTVFEPIDAYKGDFARIYFYMSTRYLNEDNGWTGSGMVEGAQLKAWALNMMMDWHEADPVSQKEIDRNNAVHDIQNNRNPFVDHPEYVDLIWGDPGDLPLAPGNLTSSNISETSVDLTWSDNASNESGFYLYQDDQRIATLAANSTSSSVDQLQAGTTYTFAVSAFNGDGESARVSLNVTTTGGASVVTHFVEDFESGSGSSYIDGDFDLSSGSWNAYQAGNFTLGNPRSGSKSIAINDDKAGAHLTTPAVNTLGTLSFYYYQRSGAASDEFRVEKSVNGAAFELVTTQGYNVGETYTLFTTQVNDTSSSVRIRIVNDDQAAHLIIDDLSLTNYEPVSIQSIGPLTPDQPQLYPAYPNPFNPVVSIRFEVSDPNSEIRLGVFDLQGREVAMLARGLFSPGTHRVHWEPGENPSGIYLIQLKSAGYQEFQRVTLLR